MGLSLEYFNAVRREEMRALLTEAGEYLKGKDILEIGSGTGAQLQILNRIGNANATGLELENAIYHQEPGLNIRSYDGLHIPFPDASFDVVFSSHAMEHIAAENQIHSEIRRVLRPRGKVIHIMPTRTWRILTSATHYPGVAKKLFAKNNYKSRAVKAIRHSSDGTLLSKIKNAAIPVQHGEFGNLFTEYWHFGIAQWRKRFQRFDWSITRIIPLTLAYSGTCLMNSRLPMPTRRRLSKIIGSSSAALILE